MAVSKAPNRQAQRSFFPLKIRTLYPVDIGADSKKRCRAEDGLDYHIKDMVSGDSNHTTPHSEWFCTRLAEAIGIACPQCAILEEHDGTLVFGSRYEGGVLTAPKIGETSGFWWQSVKSGEIKIDDISVVLSRIYAFDMFIYNDDRHSNNFVARESVNGTVLLANDYSRAWLRHGIPLPQLPMDANSNTVSQQRKFMVYWGHKYVDGKTAKELLKRIAKVPIETIEYIINSHPEAWLTLEEEKSILSWWGSRPMLKRVAEVCKGIADGSCL